MSAVTFAVKDAYSVMNTLVRQATGQTDIVAVDTSSFVDCGNKLLASGTENVLKALSVLIGRTIIASRPYQGKFRLVVENSDSEFENRIRKISFYARDNQASGMYNTDVATNLGNGLSDTDGVGSQWVQNNPRCLEMNFFSQFAWDKETTVYEEQLKVAFTNERDFIDFINGAMIEVQNDIESTLEARNRMVVLNRIAANKLLVDSSAIGAECAVNMTAEFNKTYGTAYSTEDILTLHRTEFLEFFIARFKIDSDRMANRTAKYHDPVTFSEGSDPNKVYFSILRHTPKDMQRFIYFSPVFTQLKMVFAEIFNPQYLDLPNGEGIEYWQSFEKPGAIDITPALPDGDTSSEVKIDLVLGMLFDRDALRTHNQFTGMYSTPVNARHIYRNLFWHYKYGVINDMTENAILYYMADLSETFTGDGTEDDFILTGDVHEILKVTVNGEATTAYTYDSTTQTVTFTTAPANKAVIVVTYK